MPSHWRSAKNKMGGYLIVIVMNQSKLKSFRRTKRLISTVLPAIDIRVNIGDIPKRVLIELIKNLRISVSKGVCIQLYFEEKEGFRGFKCIEFGKKTTDIKDFVFVKSKLDNDLLAKGITITP